MQGSGFGSTTWPRRVGCLVGFRKGLLRFCINGLGSGPFYFGCLIGVSVFSWYGLLQVIV